MMPWWRLLVTTVILLPLAFSQATELTPPPPIDLKTRDRGDAYLIRDACEMMPDFPGQSVLEKLRTPKDGLCDVIVHTRKRGLKNLFVEIDIRHIDTITGSTKLDPTKSVKIVQGTFSIECNPDDKKVESSDPGISIESPILFFTEDRLYCSFIMKSNRSMLERHFEKNANSPELHFFSTGAIEAIMKYEKQKGHIWIQGDARCDPSLATTIATKSEEDGILYEPVEDITAEELKCSFGRLYVEFETELFMDSITCTDVWEYKAKGVARTLAHAFKVMCRTKYCTKCTATTLPTSQCPTCTAPTFNRDAESDDCATIKCQPDIWILDGKWTYNPSIQCTQTSQPGIYKWTANEAEVNKGACTAVYNCFVYSDLKYHCDEQTGHCEKLLFDSGNSTVGCASGQKLKPKHEMNVRSESIYTCNTKTGLYTNGPRTLDRLSHVGCYVFNKDYETAKKQEKAFLVPVGLSVVFLLIGGVAVFFIILRFKRLQKAEEMRRAHEAQLARDAEEERRWEIEGAKKRNAKKGPSGQRLRHESFISAKDIKRKRRAEQRAALKAKEARAKLNSVNSTGTTSKESKNSMKSKESKNSIKSKESKKSKSKKSKKSGKSTKIAHPMKKRKYPIVLTNRRYNPKAVAKSRDAFVPLDVDMGYRTRKEATTTPSKPVSNSQVNKRVADLHKEGGVKSSAPVDKKKP